MKLQNLTAKNVVKRRRYEDGCATTHAIDVLGERWAVPVIRELMFGPRRFGELREALPAISANSLTQRLSSLEAAGVLGRHRLAPPASVMVYELTQWGHEAAPVFEALGRWGARSCGHAPSKPLSAASLMLSFRTMMDAGNAADLTAIIGFRLGTGDFVLRLDQGQPTPARDDVGTADVIFTGTPSAVAAAVYSGAPLADLEAKGALEIEGDRALAQRFVKLFPLPSKASGG